MAKNGSETPEKVLKYPQLSPRGANIQFGMPPASFSSTPGKWPKSNAKIGARCEIFSNSKIWVENFWKVGFDLGINFQVLSKSWLRLARLVRLVFRLAQYWKPK